MRRFFQTFVLCIFFPSIAGTSAVFAQEKILMDGSPYLFREEPLPHSIVMGKPEAKWPVQILSFLNVDGKNYYKGIGVFYYVERNGNSHYSSCKCYIEESQLSDSLNRRLQKELRESEFVDVEFFLYDMKEKILARKNGFFRQEDKTVRYDYTPGSYQLRKGIPAVFVIPGKTDSLITELIFNDSVPARITMNIKVKSKVTKVVNTSWQDPADYYSQLRTQRIESNNCIVEGEWRSDLWEPLWTGPCVEGHANGEGKLYYSSSHIPYYSGGIKDGLMHGYGRRYDDVITEGYWEYGKLKELKRVFYREVMITDDSYGSDYHKHGGLIYEDSALLIKSRIKPIDTAYYYSHLSTDTTFAEREMSVHTWVEGCHEHIFHISYSYSSGFMRSYHHNYFLVQCMNRKLIMISSIMGKGDKSWSLNSDGNLRGTAKEVIDAGCGC